MTAAAPNFRIQSRLAPLVETWTGIAAFLEKGAGAVLDLAIRLWLAKIFFVSGVLKTVNWEVTVFLYTNEHLVPGIEPTTAAVIGTGIELVCPILLVFGFATRLAAIPLLLTAAFLQFTYKDLADHLYWMALLGILIFRGAGALSVDYMIAPHLAGSAIPFGSSLRRIANFSDRFLLPPFELLVRVGLAWLLWRRGFSASPAALRVAGFVLCVLLGLGLAARGVALVLALLSVAVFSNVLPLGDPALRFFLLTSFGLYGGGLLSIDHLVVLQAQRLGAGHVDRPTQLPPLPAAPLPSGDGDAVAG